MGDRGPIPKRSEERRRRNEPENGPVRKVETLEPSEDPDSLPFRVREGRPIPEVESFNDVDPETVNGWHPLVVELYESARSSGQALFYEPTDWATLMLILESLDRDLRPQVVGITETGEAVRDTIPLKGASLAAYLKAFAALGFTEGDRRRMGVELERRKFGKPVVAAVSDISAARKSRLA